MFFLLLGLQPSLLKVEVHVRDEKSNEAGRGAGKRLIKLAGLKLEARSHGSFLRPLRIRLAQHHF